MIKSDSLAVKNWHALVEAYNLRQQNEVHVAADTVDMPDTAGTAFVSQVRHKGRFPDRLRVTSIAE